MFIAYPEFFSHFIIEMFKQELPGAGHRIVYLGAQLALKLLKGGLDFVRGPATLVDIGNPFFEIHSRFNGSQDLVACPKDPFEELKLFGEQAKDMLVGFISFIEKIDHDDIVLLSVPVTAADALFDTLRIPREIVVHHQGAELEIDAFRPRFRGDHDLSLFLEIVHDG